MTENFGSQKMQYDAELSWIGPDVTSGKGAGDENFPVGTVLLARKNRGHVMAYYHFARCIDDIADDPNLPRDQKAARLAAMGDILRGAPAPASRQDAQTAVVLRRHFQEVNVPIETASDLIIAFQQDLERSRYATWAELVNYCRYSANPVGRFLLLLHKEEPAILPFSDALCTALQVINHLQDASSDLRLLDRSYLPEEWLKKESVSVSDVSLSHSKPGLRRIFDLMLDEVDRLNQEALKLPGLIRDRRMRLYTAVIASLSCSLANRLRSEDPVAKRVKLKPIDVLRALLGASRHISGSHVEVGNVSR